MLKYLHYVLLAVISKTLQQLESKMYASSDYIFSNINFDNLQLNLSKTHL